MLGGASKIRKYNRKIIPILIISGIALIILPFVWRHEGKEKNNDIIEKIKKQSEDQDQTNEGIPDGILGYISIPKLDICYAITEGAEPEQLDYFIGHIPETAGIGQKGNCVLAGHRGGKNGEFFRHLDRLEAGDAVTVTDREGNVHEYTVAETYVTHAYDSDIKAQDKTKNILTLLTCNDRGTRRLVVKCEKI